MDRKKHLEYCKICTLREFDPKQGLICGLTKRKADFEGECEHFEIDEELIKSKIEKQKEEKKSKISFGFSPKQIDNLQVYDLSKKQLYVLAYEAVKKLKWDVGFLSESGFIAYTKFSLISWGEEVQIKIEVGNITVKSECTGNQLMDWGKNRRNINLFFKAFNKIREDIENIDIEARYAGLSKNFVNENEDFINSPLNKKEKIWGLFSLITPTKGYTVTPVIIILNILVFVVMVISGVNFFMPSKENMLLWGANFRPLIIEGEWWRLFTNIFLHYGIVHLLMNMYALVYIGLLLEPFLGKARFLTAYLITGISGSVASVYWHDLAISAGASGAIFGMYGVFLALLTTRLIEKSARKSLMISIGVFVFYNLVNGLHGGIDNAAHIGGLLSGMVIGYSFYPGLVKPNKILKPVTIGILTLFFSLISLAIIKNITGDIPKYNAEMQVFLKLEREALGIYRLPPDTPDKKLLIELEKGIKNWEKCLKLVEKTEMYDLPDAIRSRNALLKKYCRLRIKSYKTFRKAINEKTYKYADEINNLNNEIEAILLELR